MTDAINEKIQEMYDCSDMRSEDRMHEHERLMSEMRWLSRRRMILERYDRDRRTYNELSRVLGENFKKRFQIK